MPNHDDQPTSEDLLRQAREGLGKPPSPSDPPEVAAPEDPTLDDPSDSPEPLAAPPPPGDQPTPPPFPPSAPVEAWYAKRWIRVLAGIVAVAAFTIWRSGTFSGPSEEAFLDAFEEGFRIEGQISDESWACIEEKLRDGGYLDDLDLENIDPEDLEGLSYDSSLVDLPPGLSNFLEGVMHSSFDVSDGCLTGDELRAVLENPAAEGSPMTYGSHAQLDQLYDGCRDGSLADCDMLWGASPVASEYEDFAESCGQRNEAIDFLLSSCQIHHGDFSEVDGLVVQCEGGFFPACDELFYHSDIGSSEENVAATCGGRREYSETVTCVLALGFGSR